MMKLKRLIPLFLLCSLLLASCGTSDSNDTTEAGGTTTGAAGTTAAGTTAEQKVTTAAVTTAAVTTAAVTTGEKKPAPLVARDKEQPLRVLMIGNSFTSRNDLNKPNGILAGIAKNAGYTNLTVHTIAPGGYYLHQYMDENDNYGKEMRTRLSTTKYDVVIVQEQSNNAIVNPGDFYTACRGLKKLIDQNGAEMWLYATWGYKAGHEKLKDLGPTTETMEMKLRAAYTAIGEELGVPVIYAGAAMTKSFVDNPALNLYNADCYHPSLEASYLIGWTIFGTVFGVDPAKLSYDGPLDAIDARKLRATASYVVRRGAEVDEQYKTSSVGVKSDG